MNKSKSNNANCNKNEPLISICIPVFNRTNLIPTILSDALNQTYRNINW